MSDPVVRFAADGILFPLRALPAEDAARHLAALEVIEAARAGRLPPILNAKAHLVLPFVADLIRDGRILDPVAALIGPDIVCWGASFFAKAPGSAALVPWHQDTTYWGLTEPRAVTAWLALTPSTPANGGMRVVPGTHRAPAGHRDAATTHSMLPVGEEIAVAVDEAAAVDVVLAPGEMSIHHGLLIHGSAPNRSASRRVGLAIRYVAADVRQRAGAAVSATLVRGRDFGFYPPEPRPTAPFEPAAMASLARLMRDFTLTVRGEKERADAQG